MTSSPNHWEAISLEDVGIPKATTINPSDFPNQRFELWSVPSFPSDEPEVLTGKEIGSSKQQVFPGDVLLCKINPRINRVWVVRDPQDGLTQIASSEWIVFRSDHWHSRFLRKRFEDKWFRDLICSNVSGVGGSLTRARPKDVKTYEIALPPLNEQRRIADKIDALQAKSCRAREALETVGPLLENFRQSVLAAAFRGDLTAEWRKQHPDMEPADKLLERIRAERRARWEEAELAKMRAKGIKPKNDKWKAKYTEPEPVDATGLPELPEGWCWTSVETLSIKVTDGVHKKPNYVDDGIPFLKVKNLTCGSGISFEETSFITQEDHVEFCKRTKPEFGDILVTKDGTLGVVRVIDVDIEFSIFVSLALIKPTMDGLSRCIAGYLSSPLGQTGMKATGTGLQHIHLKDLKATILPLPPLPEQDAIAEALDHLLAKLDAAVTTVVEEAERLEQLDQSILTKAFRGELVPQDPNDEPASMLLERIKAEREAAKGKKTTRRKRK